MRVADAVCDGVVVSEPDGSAERVALALSDGDSVPLRVPLALLVDDRVADGEIDGVRDDDGVPEDEEVDVAVGEIVLLLVSDDEALCVGVTVAVNEDEGVPLPDDESDGEALDDALRE